MKRHQPRQGSPRRSLDPAESCSPKATGTRHRRPRQGRLHRRPSAAPRPSCRLAGRTSARATRRPRWARTALRHPEMARRAATSSSRVAPSEEARAEQRTELVGHCWKAKSRRRGQNITDILRVRGRAASTPAARTDIRGSVRRTPRRSSGRPATPSRSRCQGSTRTPIALAWHEAAADRTWDGVEAISRSAPR